MKSNTLLLGRLHVVALLGDLGGLLLYVLCLAHSSCLFADAHKLLPTEVAFKHQQDDR